MIDEILCYGVIKINIREHWEEVERQILSPHASFSANSKGRQHSEPPCPVRTCFQRDRDRIIHCKSFRRLKHKTQVLLLPEGDHYRTRLTHTLEVSQIARSISRALRLNEDLTEAIALGHDLGHTPFGHMGERVLNKLAKEHELSGFHHAAQSLRVVDHLEKDGAGLNLTWEVRMGILQHSKGQVDVHSGYNLANPSTMEAWVVRVSDSLAYINHDIDDAIRAGFIHKVNPPDDIKEILSIPNSRRINSMILDVIENSTESTVSFSSDMLAHLELLRSFLNKYVYSHADISAESSKVEHVITALFNYELNNNGDNAQEAVDMVSGMTDRYAMNLFQRIFVPSPWPEF
ncbi:MAG: deoxyguanosinetriphosphate triphosphohydrolase [Synergistes sp.]|nr:deoxyguanosinetriphosphate triphosphohydrolase [Synergistes sp.]